MNVLVYSGKGATTDGVRQTVETLRSFLSPYYAVSTISESALLHEPWPSKARMLVMPGGADLPYCEVLNGAGNKKITQYVRAGGKYLAFCAGGYYSSSRCEFEVGDPVLEVSGPRELGFFPGTCKGCAWRGFEYESHSCSRAATLAVNMAALGVHHAPESVLTYLNGGGVFMNASRYKNVEILARYTGTPDVVDETGDLAAVVHCKVGSGDVILSGTHPEYNPFLMKPGANDTHFQAVNAQLRDADTSRKLFVAALLSRMGLKVNRDPASATPRLTPIMVAAHNDPSRVKKIYDDLKENMDFVSHNKFEDVHDTFVLHNAAEAAAVEESADDDSSHDAIVSADKHLQMFLGSELPSGRQTPYFDMRAYFSHLNRLYDSNSVPQTERQFGSVLAYGEVVTSTSTLMDANGRWLRHLPSGFTFTASTQVAGRGRSGNVWVNPRGVMAASVVMRVSAEANRNSSIVTLQYLCSLAVVEAILGYGADAMGQGIGYEDMPVRLKWPNDMYALKPEHFTNIADKDNTSSTVDGDEQKWTKISGALVNSQFIDGQFCVVWGGGVNVSNDEPTTSLNGVLAKLNEFRAAKGLPPLPEYTHEQLLARLLFVMGRFYSVFQSSGLKPFLNLYYKRWMHTNQRIRVDAEGDGQTRECVIKGITDDYGLLLAEDVQTKDVLELQPDGNSFDIFKGLVYKKK